MVKYLLYFLLTYLLYVYVAREDYEDGLHREFEVTTQSVAVWHVSEYSRHRVSPVSHGQFHDEDAYVICWHYTITQGEDLIFCC